MIRPTCNPGPADSPAAEAATGAAAGRDAPTTTASCSLSPASEALAYRIWAYAKPRDWRCTRSDLAASLGEPAWRIRYVLDRKGWGERLLHGGANRKDVAAAEPDDLVEHFARAL